MNKRASLILLVEDDPNDALLAEKALRKAGLDQPITHLGDGEEAITYLAGEPPYNDRTRHPLPALVLLDLKMPKISGFEVLAWLKERPELADSIPVVVLSGSIHSRDMEIAKKLGALRYEVKPVEFAELVALASNLLLCLAN